MADAMTIAIQSMQNDMLRMDTISQNVANANTPGYRRVLAGSQVFGDVLQQSALSGATSNYSITLPVVTNVLDNSTGPIKATGGALDFALDGAGYFELTTPQGLAYTRAGNFHLDEEGRLVNQDGFTVNGAGGDIVSSHNGTPAISPSGVVTENGGQIGQLRIVNFADAHAFEKLDNGLLRPTGKDAQAIESTASVRTGYLEQSNVLPLREMIGLLETSRHFESQQKLFQGYDEQISSAIQKLGQF